MQHSWDHKIIFILQLGNINLNQLNLVCKHHNFFCLSDNQLKYTVNSFTTDEFFIIYSDEFLTDEKSYDFCYWNKHPKNIKFYISTVLILCYNFFFVIWYFILQIGCSLRIKTVSILVKIAAMNLSCKTNANGNKSNF